MAQEEMQASVQVEWKETTEEPFKPKGTTEIFAVMEPIEKDEGTYYPPEYIDYYNWLSPPYIPRYEDIPEFEAAPAELIINIETTKVLPWEAKIVCIGVMDPNSLVPEILNFIQDTEEATLDAFLEWWKNTTYSILVGYNVSFDYRFIYAVAQKYRRTVPRWHEAELQDIMQQQKQVKQAFVFGFNKTGTLEQWATYLLGTKPYAPQEQVYKWYREKNFEEIVNFNSDKLTKAYYLYVLDKVVSGTIPGMEVLGRPATPAAETPAGSSGTSSEAAENMVEVQCPACHDAQFMPKSAKVIKCRTCGTPIAYPSA